MATAPTWRGPIDAFTASFRERIEAPASRPVFATGIALDHRVVAGPFDPTDDLLELQATARRSPAFLWRLTRLAIEARPPLGFRGDVVVGRIGEEEGVLDVKAGGLLPVTDLARIHAIRAGITATSTIERLRGAATAGAIAPDTADALAEAFHVFLDVRLDHQAAQVTRGEPPDNLIDPSRLGRIDRGRLRDAFRIVAGVQRDLSRGVSGSRFG
jgi:CBS domain-containing protein